MTTTLSIAEQASLAADESLARDYLSDIVESRDLHALIYVAGVILVTASSGAPAWFGLEDEAI